MFGITAARNLGGIMATLAAALLVVGVYVLIEVVANPLEDQSVETIAAAVMIAFAAIMTFYLLEPRLAARFQRRQRRGTKVRSSRTTTLHLPLYPKRKMPSEPARVPGASRPAKPPYEFTLKLAESPPDSALPKSADDAVHDRR